MKRIINKTRRFVLAISMIFACAHLGGAQQSEPSPKWDSAEVVNSAGNDLNRLSEREVAPSITVQDMYINVVLDQPASVKLFTILGQPVVQKQLPAGTSRFKVEARGIYILKIGSITRRITI